MSRNGSKPVPSTIISLRKQLKTWKRRLWSERSRKEHWKHRYEELVRRLQAKSGAEGPGVLPEYLEKQRNEAIKIGQQLKWNTERIYTANNEYFRSMPYEPAGLYRFAWWNVIELADGSHTVEFYKESNNLLADVES